VSSLNPAKLHVHLRSGAAAWRMGKPRRYTLTHSDLTGDLFLKIGLDYDYKAISGLYTRLMRDEVLAEWIRVRDIPELQVYCHVSGGLVLGTPGFRYGIFQFHLPQVLQAFRYGDHGLFDEFPELDQAPVCVHFRASQARYHKVEAWGKIGDYRLELLDSQDFESQSGRAVGD
jgi:hypothetical protein